MVDFSGKLGAARLLSIVAFVLTCVYAISKFAEADYKLAGIDGPVSLYSSGYKFRIVWTAFIAFGVSGLTLYTFFKALSEDAYNLFLGASVVFLNVLMLDMMNPSVHDFRCVMAWLLFIGHAALVVLSHMWRVEILGAGFSPSADPTVAQHGQGYSNFNAPSATGADAI
ncbi:MAG: hypothetical protein MHM6MM_005995 [Cercozoa sp. M6MM]